MHEDKIKIYKKIEGSNLKNHLIRRRISATKLLINKIEMKKSFCFGLFRWKCFVKIVTTKYINKLYQCFLYQCLTFKSNFKILYETQTEYWSAEGHTYLTMMQVATRFERRQNNAKNDNVVLYKAQMYNVY